MSATGKVDVNGWPIWYEKFGSGPHVLLLIPGAIGTGRTDFDDQLFGEYALNMNEFTIVAIELPGWGRSRPPIRKLNNKIFENDSECCVKLMESLGYNKFHVLGWSEGSRVALVLSANYPNSVISMIAMALPVYPTEQNTANILKTRNIQNWGPELIGKYLKVYDSESEIQALWKRHMVFISNFPDYFPKGVCNYKYDTITCPVLIVHGDKDPLVQLEQPLHLMEKLKRAHLKRFPLGGHNVHVVYQQQFKQLVEDFFLEGKVSEN
ncbi:unnamed protein product [Medioppia subpectinata]|uniref:AB hydrolase-1 domain-containing protein n=1 Tax=Medioppia subpectinata TaxID=1979941 RepID=A0A7R9KJG9_9ACAR|nr:unnamed protein product [Medioppia subpectinata]CAG2104536.1 unnamed protein product [Medioppia subpectinata]